MSSTLEALTSLEKVTQHIVPCKCSHLPTETMVKMECTNPPKRDFDDVSISAQKTILNKKEYDR
jgi:hypothetical protein